MTPWCKIKAINDTMYTYQHQHADVGGVDGGAVSVDQIIYIDSDAFVNKLNETIHDNSRYFHKTLNMF